LLGTLAACGGDPFGKLQELQAGLDPAWVAQTQQGIPRSGLEFASGFNSHCQMILAGGRQVMLRALHQHHTYLGLLEGTPGEQMTTRKFRRRWRRAGSRDRADSRI
jgi:hypothetical protein